MNEKKVWGTVARQSESVTLQSWGIPNYWRLIVASIEAGPGKPETVKPPSSSGDLCTSTYFDSCSSVIKQLSIMDV